MRKRAKGERGNEWILEAVRGGGGGEPVVRGERGREEGAECDFTAEDDRSTSPRNVEVG